MRIAIARFSHETCTFCPRPTTSGDYEKGGVPQGEDVIEKSRGIKGYVRGFVNVAEKEGVELVGILDASRSWGGSSGSWLTPECFDKYADGITAGLKAAGKLDGLFLSLHGAMATESRQDPETDAVREVREVVGYDMPIMVAFDLHGNKDEAILKEATGIFGYHSSPHIDSGETGRRAARAMLATLAGEIKPTMAINKPGIVVPSVFSATTVSPGKDIIDRALEWEAKEGVVDVTALMGFSWSDVHQLGMSMIAVTDDDPDLAKEIVDDLAELAWEKREYLTGKAKSSLYNVEEGVALALEKAKTAKKPIVILDCADRTNDTTYVLAELMARGAQNVAHPVFYSPEGAAAAAEAGVGNMMKLEVGAHMGWRDGGPVEVEGKVIYAGEGKYIGTGPMRVNMEIDHGPTAILDMDGIWLQFVTHKTSLIDEDPIIQFGYKTQDFDVIVTKSKTHFRAVYEEVGEEIIIVDAPGQCPADTSVFDYKNIPDDLYPITKQ